MLVIIMKKLIVGLVFSFCCMLLHSSTFAQKKRTYTSSKFSLELDGPGKGFLRPVKQGDTLIYAIDKLSDSILIRKKFDSTFGTTARRFFLRYKKKNTTTVPAIKNPVSSGFLYKVSLMFIKDHYPML